MLCPQKNLVVCQGGSPAERSGYSDVQVAVGTSMRVVEIQECHYVEFLEAQKVLAVAAGEGVVPLLRLMASHFVEL